MPLKHSTETLLVLVLAVLLVLAGIMSAILPSVSEHPGAWIFLLAITILYPVSLYPFFRDRRADYEFRLLHFAPALVLFLSLLLEIAASMRPAVERLLHWYRFGWSFAIVTLILLLLWLFCLRVIRERWTRSVILLVLFVPFAVLAALSERKQWNPQLTALLTRPAELGSHSGVIIAGTQGTSSEKNLAPSSHADEEAWRMQLRRMDRRDARLAAHSLSGQTAPVRGAQNGMMIAANVQSGSSSSAPPHLPSSGMGTDALMLSMVAGYCALLHRRATLRA
jgi:hypothetical protein